MRTILTIAMMMGCIFTYAQDNGESQYVQEGDRVAVTHYYDNGNVKEVGFFKNDVPDGKWETFGVDGEKTAEINYVNGKRHGEFRVWDTFANTYTEMNYANGEIVLANKWVKGVALASPEK